MKLRKVKKVVTGEMSDFSKYCVFASILWFLFFLVVYHEVLPCVILTVFVYLFLKVSHFLYDVIGKVFGEVRDGNI